QLGRTLSESWRAMRPVLSERVSALRVQEEKATGLLLPAVAFQDGSGIGDLDYEIVIQGARHGKGTLHPDLTLAIFGAGDGPKPSGLEARDPAYGLPGVWIDDAGRDAARDLDCTLVDPITVLMTHLGEIVRTAAPQLLSRSQVVQLLEGVRTRQPGLVEDLIPAILSVSDVQRILQALLAENVSIRQIDLVIDALVDVGRHTKDHGELTERVRQRLGHAIFSALRGSHDALSVMSLSPRLESQLLEAVRRSDQSEAFVIDPRLAEQLLKKLIPLVDEMAAQRRAPVLLCGAELRRHLKTFTRRSAPRLSVVSVAEVPQSIDLHSFGVLQAE
ncbi:MAG TPA: FHIPEP family type III secretion protein, partial [Brevundimonas sp.]|nr:FHIPEP family type III secretion protein [Brevundimonas sp.]